VARQEGKETQEVKALPHAFHKKRMNPSGRLWCWQGAGHLLR